MCVLFAGERWRKQDSRMLGWYGMHVADYLVMCLDD